MDDETTASAVNVAATTEVPSSGLHFPSFASCIAAVSSTNKSGIDAIGGLSIQLQQNCPELAKILQSSAVRTSLDTYARQDAEAMRQQAYLLKEATWGNACLMAAGIISGVVLAVSAQPFGSEYWSLIANLTLALGGITLFLGAAAAFFAYIARDQGRIGRWQACRGEAEIARLAVFSTIAERAAGEGPPVALQGLAVVTCHLLEDQQKWLGARALRHRKSSETTSRWGGLASSLAFVGGSGAIIASQMKGTVWIVLAGVIGAAIGAYSANRDALLRDRSNADRYEKAQVALDRLAGRTDDVANKIVGGEPKALVAFTDAVTDLLATEHKQWLEGTAQAEASLGKLDAQLEQITKDGKEAGDPHAVPGRP
jgi:hypothetical protein